MRDAIRNALDAENALPLKCFTLAELRNYKLPDDGVPDWMGGSITWEEVAELEPKLDVMYRTIRMLRRPPRPAIFCADRTWRAIFRPRLKNLVGWTAQRKNSALRSSQAYDAAYQKLCRAMPDCRGCWCF